jgi:hypothetical protein
VDKLILQKEINGYVKRKKIYFENRDNTLLYGVNVARHCRLN